MEDRVEKMSLMRKKIAEHMTFSKQTSAHVTSVYEIDMTNVAKFRTANQAAFQAKFGTKLRAGSSQGVARLSARMPHSCIVRRLGTEMRGGHQSGGSLSRLGLCNCSIKIAPAKSR